MKDRHSPRNGSQPAPGNDLASLIEAEARLGQTLASARQHAARLVEEARMAAAAEELEVSREISAARERLGAEIQEESGRLSAEVAAEGRRAAGALDAMTDSRIAELATVVIERLLDGVAEPDR